MLAKSAVAPLKVHSQNLEHDASDSKAAVFVGFEFILNRMEVAMKIMVKLLVLAASGTLTATVHAGQGQAAIRIESVAHGTSTPLNAHAPMLPGWQPGSQPYDVRYPKRPGKGGGGGNTGGGGSWSDPALQTSHITQSFLPGTVFQGQGFTGALPPDMQLSVPMLPCTAMQLRESFQSARTNRAS